MFEIENGIIKISVRTLVEFLCRSGNIDNRFGGISDKKAMEAGQKAHKRIQKSMGPDYRAEVPLKFDIPGENYDIIIEGRADGIFERDELVIVDEIKGTYADVRYYVEPVMVHKAQAMCYAWFYMMMNDLKKIGIRITYASFESTDVKYFEEELGREELKKWFEQLLMEFYRFGDFLFEHMKERKATIGELKFPFEYRQGQRNLAVNVYRAIENQKNLFIQAPTGSGKTLSTLFPAIKAMGEEKTKKIFYLTAKTITRTAALDAISLLSLNGLKLKSLVITAKEKICLLDDEAKTECNPIACPYAKGHNDRINEAIYDIITHENIISKQKVEEYAIKHMVCPFEFSLDISYWMDVIICDYNYVFDPHVRLKRYFSQETGSYYTFLVDEAHNLPDRAREMFSAAIFKDELLAVKKYEGLSKRVVNAIEKCNKELLNHKKGCSEQYQILDSVDSFAYKMQSLSDEIAYFLENHREYPLMKELAFFYFDVLHFNNIYERLNENYVIYVEHTKQGFMLKLLCVNPSKNLNEVLAISAGTVFFSATLLPVNYYKELLSGDTKDMAIYAKSSFDTKRQLLLIAKDVTSRYVRRTVQEYEKIADYILNAVSVRKGNYMVFLPSYKYLEDVSAVIESKCDDNECILVKQKNNMDEEEKEKFLEMFDDAGADKTLLALCVMGGVFSEGIDLRNDRLIGAFIVGTGLPSINTESQLFRQFYDEKENCGYEYAYVYPGMNKVLQAAGRVIRTEEDCGMIFLMDDRFYSRQYLNLFPAEWKNFTVVGKKEACQEILDFWNELIYNETENVSFGTKGWDI